MDATVNVVCYRWKTLSNGEHPLMVRICKDGKKKYKSLGISIKPTCWDFIQGYPNVIAALKEGYASIGYERERNTLVNLNKFLVKKRMLVKEGKGYRYNPYFHY